MDDGILKDHIASLDRLAEQLQDNEHALALLLKERRLVILKLGYDIEDNGLYRKVTGA